MYKRQIQERTGRDLGATFLSGTTISNSRTELYLLFKYLRPQALDRQIQLALKPVGSDRDGEEAGEQQEQRQEKDARRCV